MADFRIAYNITMGHEGGYANHPNDRGGETYKGIARNSWPQWQGWQTVDRLKGTPGFERLLDANEPLQDQVREFYRVNFWQPIQGDAIENQTVANLMFDVGVNMGVTWGVRFAQSAIGGSLRVDGRMGPNTMAAINRMGTALERPFRAQWRRRYIDICRATPSQLVFLLGWLRRTGIEIA